MLLVLGYTHLLLTGEPFLPGECVQQKSLPPEKLWKGEPCSFQAEQSRAAGWWDKDFADVHICSVQKEPCISERALKQLQSSQLHWIPARALLYLFCSAREVFCGFCAAGELWCLSPWQFYSQNTHRSWHVLVTFAQPLGASLSDYNPSSPAVTPKSLQYVWASVEFLRRVGQFYFLAVPSVA